MNQIDEESNIALYIDELKSDDNSLKINAISKLTLISQKLSKTRIEQELFPYIRYIIEEMDNEDEFLILISKNILELLKKNRNIDKKEVIQILEPLTILEDLKIREGSIDVLVFISENCKKEIFDVILRLSMFDNKNGRISALRILCKILEKNFFFFEEKFMEIEKICIVLLNDGFLAVRRMALKFLGFFFRNKKLLGKYKMEIFEQNFLDICKELYNENTPEGILFEILDNNFSKSFFGILTQIEKKILSEKILDFLKIDISWRVHYIILNNNIIINEEIKNYEEFLEIFKSEFKNSEQEIKNSVIRALINLVTKIDSCEKMENFWKIFENFLKNVLMANNNIYVKKNLLSFLIELLKKKNYKINLIEETFILFLGFLELDTNFNEVKINAIEYIQIFFTELQNVKEYKQNFSKARVLPYKKTEPIKNDNLEEELNLLKKNKEQKLIYESSEIMSEDIFIILEKFAKNKNWKIRFSILEKIGSILDNFILKEKIENFEILKKLFEINIFFGEDLILINRNLIIENFIKFFEILEKKFVKDQIIRFIENWLNHKNYVFRISGLKSIFILYEKIFDLENIENLIKRNFERFMNEKIINVKINVLKLFENLLLKFDNKNFKFIALSDQILNSYKNDDDPDVQFYIERINAIRS